MADYIKIIYKDGEIWRAKRDVDDNTYYSDGVAYSGGAGQEGGCELSPCEFVDQTFEELLKDNTLQVSIITEDEYNNHTNGLMITILNEEIELLEEKIKDKIRKKEEFLNQLKNDN